MAPRLLHLDSAPGHRLLGQGWGVDSICSPDPRGDPECKDLPPVLPRSPGRRLEDLVLRCLANPEWARCPEDLGVVAVVLRDRA